MMVDPDFDFTDLSPSEVRVGAALSEIARRGGLATVESHGDQMRNGGRATVESHGDQMRNGGLATVESHGGILA